MWPLRYGTIGFLGSAFGIDSLLLSEEGSLAFEENPTPIPYDRLCMDVS
jgi:hypothetical protein